MRHIELLKWTSVIAAFKSKAFVNNFLLSIALGFSLTSAFAADEPILIDNLPSELDLLDLEDLDSVDAPIDLDALSENNRQPASPEIVETEPVAQNTAPKTSPSPNVEKVNVVEINETYYLLEYDKNTGNFSRSITQEANPGDLIEIQVTATNLSDQIVKEVEMVNSIPTGPVAFIADSVTLDDKQGFYRISTSGQTFFPPEAEISPSEIRFIKWQIFSLAVNSTLTLSYQIQIAK